MEVLENIDVSSLSYYKIGGKTKILLQVENVSDVKDALRFIKNHPTLPVRILSLGANLLLPDENFEGITIHFKGLGKSFVEKDNNVVSFSGELFDSLINFSFGKNLIGLEWAGGLPSSVGGAVRGNAGAFGSEVKDSVQSVKAIDMNDHTMQEREFPLNECNFTYRSSFFKQNNNFIITQVTFSLKKATDKELGNAKEIYKQNIEYREKNHPMQYPSCGSVFKNIVDEQSVGKIIKAWPDVENLSRNSWHNKISMGYVINRLGFAGKRIGGAQVSEKHTNYIVNVDHAKYEDVKMLIKEISDKFSETFGFAPEAEVVIV